MGKVKLRLLLIEDNPGDAELVQEYLLESQVHSFQVTHCVRVSEALKFLKKGEHTDIILSDVSLPDTVGIATFRKLRDSAISTPLVFMTGTIPDEEAAIQALQEGAQDYLVKGQFTADLLLRSLRYAIERKKSEEALKQSEEHFRLLVEGAQEFAIILLDKKGVVASWNKGAENLFGYTEKEILGKNFSIFFTSEDKKKRLPAIELNTALRNGKANDENWLMRKDGTKFWASGISTAIYDTSGKLKGIAKIARDVTVRMQLEKQKDEFMSIASHELKTPVTSLKAYTQVLQAMFKKKGDEKSVFHLEKMNSQLNKLTDLIGDLLDVTKIESGQLQLHTTRFDFDVFVDDVVESMQLTTEKHKLIHKGKTNKKIHADKERIGQVLTNLISNAIKYSPHTDKIIINSSVKKEHVEVCIQDFGVGISKEKQDKVFERFFRVSGPNTHTFPGLGLGLYISSEIIKRLGGRIWVESTKGKGSVFCFTLPIEKKEN